MKTISSGLATSFADGATTLCHVLTITLKDGTILYFTSLDRPVVYSLHTFLPSGIEVSAKRSSFNAAQDSLTFTMTLDVDAAITEDAVRRGVFDKATFLLEVIDYTSPANGSMVLDVGSFSDISFNERGRCEIDTLGLLASYSVSIGEVYSQECRNEFGDAQCRFPLETINVEGAIDTVSLDNFVFSASELNTFPAGHFNLGYVEFTSGSNNGTVIEVAGSEIGSITLFLPPSFPMTPGTTFIATPGCNFQLSMCHDRYDNVLNYRGEPHVPPIEAQNIQLQGATSPTAGALYGGNAAGGSGSQGPVGSTDGTTGVVVNPAFPVFSR